MQADSRHPHFRRHPPAVERSFQGSVFDVADARRLARVTASWWGVDPGPVELVVDELSRRAVCSDHPGFRVSLTLDGSDVRVRVAEVEAGDSSHGGMSPIRSMRSHGWVRPR